MMHKPHVTKEFNFVSEHTINKPYLRYYIVPKETVLYRGTTTRIPLKLKDSPLFLTTSKKAASIYGYIHEYKTTHDMFLVDLADFETHKNFQRVFQTMYLKTTPHHPINPLAFSTSFPVDNRSRVLRDSEFASDDVVVTYFQWLDTQGYFVPFSGWATDVMPTTAYNSVHHNELIVLHPNKELEYVETLTVPFHESVLSIRAKHVQKEQAIKRRSKRQEALEEYELEQEPEMSENPKKPDFSNVLEELEESEEPEKSQESKTSIRTKRKLAF